MDFQKSRLPIADWWTSDHCLLPGSRVTDVSNSSSQRDFIHEHKCRNLVLLQSAGKLHGKKKKKKGCNDPVPQCADLPALLSIYSQNIKSGRCTVHSVCMSSLAQFFYRRSLREWSLPLSSRSGWDVRSLYLNTLIFVTPQTCRKDPSLQLHLMQLCVGHVGKGYDGIKSYVNGMIWDKNYLIKFSLLYLFDFFFFLDF